MMKVKKVDKMTDKEVDDEISKLIEYEQLEDVPIWN